MTSALLTTLSENWMNYIFGSAAIAGLFILLAVLIFGFYMGLPILGMVIIGLPTLFLLSYFSIFPLGIDIIAYIVVGVIIALAIAKLFRST